MIQIWVTLWLLENLLQNGTTNRECSQGRWHLSTQLIIIKQPVITWKWVITTNHRNWAEAIHSIIGISIVVFKTHFGIKWRCLICCLGTSEVPQIALKCNYLMEQMILTILEGGEAGQDLQGLIHSDCCARDPWKNGKYKLKQRLVEALLYNKISPTATKTQPLWLLPFLLKYHYHWFTIW